MLRHLAALFALACAPAFAGPIELLASINRTTWIQTDQGPAAPFLGQWLVTLCDPAGPCHAAITDGNPDGATFLETRGGNYSALSYAVAGSTAYFGTWTSADGYSVWKTDGTPQGTTPVAGANLVSFVSPLAAAGSSVVFEGPGGLWSFSPNTSPARIASLQNVRQMVAMGGIVYFTADDGVHGNELWRSDGTAAGTRIVKDIVAGVDASAPYGLAVVGSHLFFFARAAADANYSAWVSDGTDATSLSFATTGTDSAWVGLRGRAYAFAGNGSQVVLLASDGTAAGTSALLMAPPGATALAATADRLYFIANDATTTQVWVSDGSSAGTFPITTFASGSAAPSGLRTTSDAAYFSASSGLFVSTGPTLSARLVSNATVHPLTAVGSRMLAWREIPGGGATAFITDGTAAGTVAVTTAPGGLNDNAFCARGSIALNGRVVFAANDGIHGCRPWVTDGTEAGTLLLTDAQPGRPGFPWYNSQAYFASDGSFAYFTLGISLWRTDGTPAGTQKLADLPDMPTLLKVAGNYLYFALRGTGYNDGLWRADLSGQNATHVVNDFIYDLGEVDGRVLFSTSTNIIPVTTKLWVVEGTAAPVLLYQSTGRDDFWFFMRGAGRLYASSSGGPEWGTILETDGTVAGTHPVTLPPTPTQPYALGVPISVLNDGRLVFSSVDPDPRGYARVYVTNPSGPPVALPATSSYGIPSLGISAGPYVYFTLRSSASTVALWRTDGTVNGTVVVSSQFTGTNLAAAGPRLFMLNRDATTGTEIWFTNGDPGNLSLLQDYAPGTRDILEWGYGGGIEFIETPTGVLFFAGARSPYVLDPLFVPYVPRADPFSFASLVDVPPGTFATSAPARIMGLYAPSMAVATGGEVCVSSTNACACDIAPFASSAPVGNGQYVCARVTEPSTSLVTTIVTVDIGGTRAQFSSTTAPMQHITVSVGGASGRVSGLPGGDCTGTCAVDVPRSSRLTLYGIRNHGAIFSGWSGGTCTGIGACSFVVAGDATLHADFAPLARRLDPPDFDGDGRGDLLWQHPTQGAGEWMMSGTQPISGASFAGPTTTSRIAFSNADFDGDGRSDILWRSSTGRYDISLMQGGNRVTTMIYDSGTAWQVAFTADLDGDGKSDLIWRSSSGAYAAWLMNGGTVVGGGNFMPPASSAQLSKVLDFDGDGKMDLLWARADGGYDITFMNGVGVKSSQSILPGGTGWSVVGSGDFNGDGKADLLWKHTNGSFGLWLIDGAAVPPAGIVTNGATWSGFPAGWSIVGTADLNGDGQSDILWANTNGTVSAWLMNGIAPFAAKDLMGAGSGWSLVMTRDFNGDGKDDILWRHTSGQYAIWLMDGLTPTAGSTVLGGGTGWEAVP